MWVLGSLSRFASGSERRVMLPMSRVSKTFTVSEKKSVNVSAFKSRI